MMCFFWSALACIDNDRTLKRRGKTAAEKLNMYTPHKANWWSGEVYSQQFYSTNSSACDLVVIPHQEDL
ncbi:hypothetical protein CHARACLAT_022403 [Characodon lateralis]|uniref:Uncharacterized protein n=1 Tax=Characodon lateralis TaxID=208331 RepID=A0ABU7EN30_9TELE|nr:hypothetical protein [Characodon lateralis]